MSCTNVKICEYVFKKARHLFIFIYPRVNKCLGFIYIYMP